MPPKARSAVERVLDKIEIGFPWEDEDCWEFTGAKLKDGHGRVREGLAHRVVYEALVGPIPEGHQLHHLCENPPCVNPKHLRSVTPGEHREAHRKGLCAAGLHPILPSSKRCLTCQSEWCRKRWRTMSPKDRQRTYAKQRASETRRQAYNGGAK